MLQISYKVVGVVGWNVLFSDSAGNQTMEKLNANGKNVTSVVPGFSAPAQSIVPMANRLVTLNWQFNYVYPTPQTALLAALALDNSIDGASVHFQLQVGAPSPRAFYYPNCSVDDFNWDVQGSSVGITIGAKANPLTTVAPTT